MLRRAPAQASQLYFIVLFYASLLLAGCASTQLNYNTLDLGSSSDDLITKQVLLNLSNFIESDLAIPAQIEIASGSASTTLSITPQFTDPLSKAIQATETVATTVAAAVSTTKTGQELTTKAAKQALLSGSDGWTQGWTFTPIEDPFQLRRLRAVYRYALDGDRNRLLDSYPILTKSVGEQKSICVADPVTGRMVTQKISIADNRNRVVEVNDCVIKTSGASSILGAGYLNSGHTLSNNFAVPDEYYLRRPACVICLRRGQQIFREADLQVNERLEAGWLRWRSIPGAPAHARADRSPGPNDIFLGRYGFYLLYVAPEDADKFAEFTLFVLTATLQGSGGGAPGAASTGGGAASKGPTKEFAQPSAGPMFFPTIPQ
jgi:hypothetical protein